MALTRPPVLPVWADTGDKVQPSDPELAEGWPLSSIPPARQRFNWLTNYLMNGVRYLARRGIPDHSNTDTYKIGDKVYGTDGKTYKSLIDDNLALDPASAPNLGVSWERWGYTAAELALYMRGSQLSPTPCPVTGPAAAPSLGSPYMLWKSVSPYGEYWHWLGDAWKVLSNKYTFANRYDTRPTGTVLSTVAPRSGTITLHISGLLPLTAVSRGLELSIEVAGQLIARARDANNSSYSYYMSVSASAKIKVSAGQAIVFSIVVDGVTNADYVWVSYGYDD